MCETAMKLKKQIIDIYLCTYIHITVYTYVCMDLCTKTSNKNKDTKYQINSFARASLNN